MEGGHARDALVNMTGGVGEDISVADYTESEEKRKKLFQILNSAIEDRALISASISVKNCHTVKLSILRFICKLSFLKSFNFVSSVASNSRR